MTLYIAKYTTLPALPVRRLQNHMGFIMLPSQGIASDLDEQGLWLESTWGVIILNMMQVSLATFYEFATKLHIVVSGICTLLEVRVDLNTPRLLDRDTA